MIIRNLTIEICMVQSCVLYPVENQSKIIIVYNSMKKSDQA